MRLSIRQPTGIAPKIDATQLKDNAAQIALNCCIDQADLRAIRGVSMVRQDWGTPLSIYRFGEDITNPALYWFRSANVVDYLKAPFFGDTRELTMYTELGTLKYTTNTAALAGEPYPSVSYEIPGPPTGTMGATVTGTGEGVDISYGYVMTVVTAEGFQTRFGAATAVVAKVGQTVTLTQQTMPSGPYNFGAGSLRRLWRTTNAGTLELRAEKAGADATDWVDVVAADSMLEQLLEPFNLEPPEDAHSLIGMPGSFNMLASDRDIYPSKIAPNVHAYPEEYRIKLEHPVVGQCAFDDGAVVGTTGWPVVVVGNDPSSLQPLYRKSFKQACVSKRSMAAVFNGVVYASKDGLCHCTLSESKVLTKDLFKPKQWLDTFNPSSIHGYAWQERYIGFYDAGGGNRGGFIFDPADARQPFSLFDTYASTGYLDPMHGQLFLQIDNDLVVWDAGALLTFTWRSKKFVLPHDMNFSCARVMATDYTTLTFTLYGDGAVIETRAITDDAPFRLHSRTRYRVVEVQVAGQGKVHAIDVATSLRALSNG